VKQRIRSEEIRGVIAIMPTPATDDAGRWEAEETVDIAESKRAVHAFIEDGVDGLMTNGTLGEGPTLTWEEHLTFAEAVLEAAEGKIPVFIGATTLNTRDTIKKAKAFRDLGADGLLLGRPMWCENDEDTLVGFYQDVAEAVPELAIVVYDNPEAFKGKISSRAYARLAEIPQIVAAKYIGVGQSYLADLEAVKGKIRLMPMESDWYYAWKWAPEEALACWSSSASCGPAPAVALKEAIFQGDENKARQITKEIRYTFETFFPDGDFHKFSIYNIGLEKERFNAAGYMKAGPCRPPYRHLPQDYLNGARIAGERWAQLHQKYSKKD